MVEQQKQSQFFKILYLSSAFNIRATTTKTSGWPFSEYWLKYVRQTKRSENVGKGRQMPRTTFPTAGFGCPKNRAN